MDLATGVWRQRPNAVTQAPFGGISHFSEYNPNHNVMFFDGDQAPNINESRRFYMLDKNRKVTRLADASTKLGQFGSAPVQTIDSASGNLIVFQGQHNDGSPGCADSLPIWEYNLDNNTLGSSGNTATYGSVLHDEYGCSAAL